MCMDEWNRPAPIRRELSLTQAVWGKLDRTGPALIVGMKTRSLEEFLQYFAFHNLFTKKRDAKSGKVF